MWCYLTGQSPDAWNQLTRIERRQFENAAVDAKKKGW